MIELTVNGVAFTEFLSASVTMRLDALARDFAFTASADGDFPPIREGDPVEVYVDRVKVLTGVVGEVNGEEGEGSHFVQYSGRDLTGDLIDSQISIIDDLRADSLTLVEIVRAVVKHIGVPVTVFDMLLPRPFSSAEDVITPQAGEGAIGFLRRFASKRAALLVADGDSRIVITQSSPTDSGEAVTRPGNILTQSWSVSGSEQFNKYIRHGQLDLRALNKAGKTSTKTVTDQSSEVTDDDVRVGRQSVVVEGDSYSAAQLTDRAKWAKQLAKAKATRFRCTVQGHAKPKNGGLWELNELVQVNSSAADITRKMLVNSLTFSQGEGAPTITSLEFVEQNVYTTNEKLLSQRPAGRQNDAFKSVG